MKTLIILRHAKTESGQSAQSDESRALIPRGVEAAQAMGAHLAFLGIHPDKILCSSAARTRQTAAAILPALGDPPIEYLTKLYQASATEMLAELEKLPGAVQRVLILAHNPGIHQLSLKLSCQGDETLLDELALKFPTAACAIIDLPIEDWADAKRGGTLRHFTTPATLQGHDYED